MKTLPRSNSVGIKDATMPPVSLNVCMHVLGPARPDVRVMREATTLVQFGKMKGTVWFSSIKKS